ncbi:MAG: branched-chain amino acid ABC transporter substrate-binding protein [Chloroflexota bacterium]|nr:branched-chain amino acid ABC transporter substrate-binding protein [Chloroflexota bacterium]
MVDPRFDTLVEQVRTGAIDRRTFLARSFAIGISAGVAGSVLATTVSAQDASPAAAGGLTPENLGVEGVEHITDTSKGTINIYSSWPLSGASEQIGGDSVAAVQFAVDLWGGAAGGYAINYQALDDGIAANNGAWDATAEANNATRVINDEDAMAYIATYNSGAAVASIPIMNEAGMAMISPANTALQLTQENEANEEGYPEVLYPSGTRNYMRVVPNDFLQGRASANFMINGLGAQTVYVLHDNQVYGLGLGNVVNEGLVELGAEVVGFEAFQPDAPEYQALATKIANAAPDVVYISAIVNLNASKLVQDLRDVMAPEDTAIMGPDGLINQAFIDGAGDGAEGMYLTFGGLPANELEGVGAEWYTQFREIVGHEPDAYAVYSFEAAIVVLQAIDRVGVNDRAAILDAMFTTEGFRGLIGTWSFTETGDTTAATISLNVVQDSVITFQEVIGLPE